MKSVLWYEIIDVHCDEGDYKAFIIEFFEKFRMELMYRTD